MSTLLAFTRYTFARKLRLLVTKRERSCEATVKIAARVSRAHRAASRARIAAAVSGARIVASGPPPCARRRGRVPMRARRRPVARSGAERTSSADDLQVEAAGEAGGGADDDRAHVGGAGGDAELSGAERGALRRGGVGALGHVGGAEDDGVRFAALADGGGAARARDHRSGGDVGEQQRAGRHVGARRLAAELVGVRRGPAGELEFAGLLALQVVRVQARRDAVAVGSE